MINEKHKRKWLHLTLKIIAGFVVLFILACFAVDQLMQFRMSDNDLNNFLNKNKVKGKIGYYNYHGRKIRFVSVGNDTLPTLFFIHGAPSSLSLYTDYYKDSLFLRTFKMLAVDRPGYGFSGFGKPVTSIKEQAEMIRPVLDSFTKARHPVILVGGSYGTSIACQLVISHPGIADGLILIGPSLAAGQEKVFWFTYIIERPLLNWFIPRAFKSANKEKIAHFNELNKMLPYWKNIRIPVMYLQGEKDELIYTTNADFARKHLINAPYLSIEFFKGRPHFIPITERQAIRKRILQMLEIIKQKESNRN